MSMAMSECWLALLRASSFGRLPNDHGRGAERGGVEIADEHADPRAARTTGRSQRRLSVVFAVR